MSDLLELARAALEHAEGNEDVEAFATHDKTFQARAHGGEIESVSSAEPRGLGVRVVHGGHVGFAYTSHLDGDGVEAVVARARTNASFTTEDPAVGLAAAWESDPPDIDGLADPGFGVIAADDKARFARDLDAATRAVDPRIRVVEDAVYSDSYSEVALASTRGISASYSRSDAWCYAVAIADDGTDTEVGFEFDLARSLAGLDVDDVAHRAASHALSVLGARKIPSARMPVVFEPYVAGQFLGVLAGALTAEAVQKGRSLFAGRLGERVAGSVTLIDDGTISGAPGSAPWDDEGTPTTCTGVIVDGELRNFLYDLTSARRDGNESTGNASRAGFKSAPGPSPTNLTISSTGETRAEVLRDAGRAFLVQDLHGVHSGANPVSGDFSVGATGRLVVDGEPGAAIKEVTIAAPMLDILAGVVAVADDLRWLPFGGSLGGATTLIGEMTVAGA